MADAAIQIAETIQTAHIKRHPSPTHDINPSTAASTKEPVVLSPQSSSAAASVATDEVPLSALRPQRRHAQLPPLPDLRFEQSYLASIKDAKTPGMVAWITIRDQVRYSCSYNVAIADVKEKNPNHPKTITDSSSFSSPSFKAHFGRLC